MVFSPEHITELIEHALEDRPNECCGIIGRRQNQSARVFRADNAAASPLRYELASGDLLRIFDELDEADLELGAIYHSHTRSAAYPSQTDINLALYPDALYVIISVVDADNPEVKAFRIVDRKVTEVPLV